ncbi:hypothetical protein ACJMK2_028263 [Sinanodonta woodiana]|uniref:SOCS box domain-containing protein n=1 Tax=Sinanodonta woodiana TaxID=1069815 RepID=A0ABD3XA24_SINWO
MEYHSITLEKSHRSIRDMESTPLRLPVLNRRYSHDDDIMTTDIDYFEDDLNDVILRNDRIALLEYLKKGLDPDHVFRSRERQDRLGKTILETAVTAGHKDIVKLLIENRCNPDLMYIININDYVCLLQPYKKKNHLKMTCMYRCIVKEDVDTIKLLVQGGSDVNIYDDRGCSALWHAVDLDNYQMVKAMVQCKRVDVNVADRTMLRPIHVASMRGNTKMVSLLISKGAEVDPVQLRGSTALILACRKGCYETVRLLILNGADPNHAGYNGHMPLSTVLQWSLDTRLPIMLLESGARVDPDLVKKCTQENLPIIKDHPDLLEILKSCSETPRTLKIQCCLLLRRTLVNCKVKLHLMKKVEQLPLPRLIKEFLLLGHLL